MLLDINKPEVQIFLTECYEKELRLRVIWNINNRESIKKAANLTRPPTNYKSLDVAKYNMVEGMATVSRDHIASGVNRMRAFKRDGTIPGVKQLRHEFSIVNMGLGDPESDPRLTRPDTSPDPDPVMRPVNPELQEYIYKGRPEFGRIKYLKERAEINLDKKYYFAECTSWDYGWRIDDSWTRSGPQHGRYCELMRTLHSKVGPAPDPPHYRSPDALLPSRCTM